MKMFRRVLSLVLAGMLLLSSAAFAEGNSFTYYSQLDANQKALYKQIASTADSTAGDRITLRLPNPITYTADESGESRKADRKFARIGQGALDALLYDHPEIIRVDKSGCTTSAEVKGYSDGSSEYKWTISTLLMDVSALPGSAAREAALQKALFAPEGATRYDQVKFLHDRLCEKVTYGESAQARSPYGALVEGTAVCEGYAKAFKMLCDAADIPCVIVTGTGFTSKTAKEGENHMWNYVQMEDGKWYAVDATWNDQPDGIRRDFFLVGRVTLSREDFGGLTFGESHLADGDFSKSGVEFQFPELSAKKYRPAA